MDLHEFKRRVLAEALALAVSPDQATRERGMAARIASEILDFSDWNEACAADVMSALRRCLDGRLDAFAVLDALLDVVCRKECHRAERISKPLAAVARTAFERQKFMSLHLVLVQMLDHDVLAQVVEPNWVEAGVRWGITRNFSARDPAGELLHLYVPRFGTDHEWLRSIVREHPEVLRSRWLDVETKLAVHGTAPTAKAWLHFVEFAVDDALMQLGPEVFACRLGAAIETLQEGIAEVRLHDNDDTRVVVLAGWLSRLLLAA